jgi:transposase
MFEFGAKLPRMVVRQEQALRRFLDDGRLPMTNNHSERGLRTIAIGRKNWLFCGSDDHASATANLFSLMASCKLHGLDPEQYLAEVIHVFPQWPRDRWLELSPRDWAHTRSRLVASELEREVGPITIPPSE